jgi:hypothetical protein
MCLYVSLVVVFFAGLTACGSSSPSHTTVTGASGPPDQTVTDVSAAKSSSTLGGCGRSLQQLADEPRTARPEQVAIEGMIAALDRHPVAFKCASSHVTVGARRPAGAAVNGQADLACLAASNYIQVLETPPPGILAARQQTAGPVQQAARLAIAAINRYEHHGNTFCEYP